MTESEFSTVKEWLKELTKVWCANLD